MPSASSAGSLSITVRRVSMVVPCLAKTAPAMAAVKTTRPRSCKRTKASRHDRIVRGTTHPGDRDQPAAFGEPRQGRREMCRKAASAMRRSTLAMAENGGFISTTLGVMPMSR